MDAYYQKRSNRMAKIMTTDEKSAYETARDEAALKFSLVTTPEIAITLCHNGKFKDFESGADWGYKYSLESDVVRGLVEAIQEGDQYNKSQALKNYHDLISKLNRETGGEG